jgi:hypothetical protein
MKKIIFGTLLLAGLIQASSVALNVNSDDVEVEGRIDITSTIGYGSGTTYFLGGDYLHTENDDLVKATFGASNTLSGAEGLTFTLGLEGVFGDNYVAMPFFGEAALRLPLDEPIPATTLSAKFSYAPSVLSFVDADQYVEYRFEADMEVISNIHVYGGYRNIDTDYETHDYNLNDSWYGGLKISF